MELVAKDTKQESRIAVLTKVIIILVSIYVMLDICSDILSHRFVQIGRHVVLASSFIYPLTYLVNDVITEVIGLKSAKLMIWIGLLIDFLFVGILFLVLFLPSPKDWALNAAYSQITWSLSRLTLGAFLGVIAARFLNVYIMAKGKIIFTGRLFWLRCMVASSSAIVLHSLITITVIYYGEISVSQYTSIVISNCVTDLLSTFCLSWISVLIAYYLKYNLGIYAQESYVNFNPFRV